MNRDIVDTCHGPPLKGQNDQQCHAMSKPNCVEVQVKAMTPCTTCVTGHTASPQIESRGAKRHVVACVPFAMQTGTTQWALEH